MDSFQALPSNNNCLQRQRAYHHACHDGGRSVQQQQAHLFPATSECCSGAMSNDSSRGERCGLPATGWRSDGTRLRNKDGNQEQQQQQNAGKMDNSVQNQHVTDVVATCPPAQNNSNNSNNSLNISLVRVGEKVSFSTIVEAVLIPSISDIDAQSKRDIWWQAPDYTEFRKNYVRFIRTPSIEDDPDWEAAPTADPVASPTSVAVAPPAGVEVEIAPLAAGGTAVVQDAVLVVASAAVSPAPAVHNVAHDKQQPQQHTMMKQKNVANRYKHAGQYSKKHESVYRPAGGGGGYDDCRKKLGAYNSAGQDGTTANYRQQQHQHNQAVRSPPFNGQPAYQQRDGLEKMFSNPHQYHNNAPRGSANGNGHGNMIGVHNANAGHHHGSLPRGSMNRPYAVVDYRGVPSGVSQGAAAAPMPPAVFELARRAQRQQRVQPQQQCREQGQGGAGVMMPGFSLWRGPVMYAPAVVYHHHHHQPAPIGVMRQ